MLLEAAEESLPDDSATRRQIDQALQTARESLGEARRLVRALMPEPLVRESLPGALELLTDRLAQAAIDARTVITGRPRPLPTGHETALLRVAQEALANVRRHADGGVPRGSDCARSLWLPRRVQHRFPVPLHGAADARVVGFPSTGRHHGSRRPWPWVFTLGYVLVAPLGCTTSATPMVVNGVGDVGGATRCNALIFTYAGDIPYSPPTWPALLFGAALATAVALLVRRAIRRRRTPAIPR